MIKLDNCKLYWTTTRLELFVLQPNLIVFDHVKVADYRAAFIMPIYPIVVQRPESHLNKVFGVVLLLELLDGLPQPAGARLLPLKGGRLHD